jgi:hypothetical protein
MVCDHSARVERVSLYRNLGRAKIKRGDSRVYGKTLATLATCV